MASSSSSAAAAAPATPAAPEAPHRFFLSPLSLRTTMVYMEEIKKEKHAAGQTEAERRASIDDQNDREMLAAIEASRTDIAAPEAATPRMEQDLDPTQKPNDDTENKPCGTKDNARSTTRHPAA